MKSVVRDKLIIALQMDDILAAINTPLRTRKAKLILDYKGAQPTLWLETPSAPRQMIMWLDTRKKISYLCQQIEPAGSIVRDMSDRLAKLESNLVLVCNKPPNKKMEALLQVRVGGSTHIAATFMKACRGETKQDTEFQFP